MRYFEILLKLAFLALSICLLITQATTSLLFCALLVVSVLLGFILIINKKTSYGSWGSDNKDYVMRRVEGVILIVAAVAGYFVTHIK